MQEVTLKSFFAVMVIGNEKIKLVLLDCDQKSYWIQIL